MRRTISIVYVVISLCMVVASGCSLKSPEKLLHPEGTEFSSVVANAKTQGDSEELVALDLVAALVQISEMSPAKVILEVNDLSNSFDRHVQSALNSAGYRQHSEDPSLQWFSVVTAINSTNGLAPVASDVSEASVKTYQIKIRDIMLKRDYLFDNGQIEPRSWMYIKGADAMHVELDKNIFDMPVVDYATAGQRSPIRPLPVDGPALKTPISERLPPVGANARLPDARSDSGSVLPLVVHAGPEVGSNLSVGDPMRITVEVGQASRIHCYYEDSAGTVARLFPNRYQRNSMVNAGETLVLPESNHWQLSAPLTGETEHVMCIAIAPDGYEGVGTSPLLPDLLPIVATDLSEIRKRYEAAAGTELVNREISIVVD